MSVDDSITDRTGVPAPDHPTVHGSASYMGCHHCEEGSLIYDQEAGASRCRACGRLD